MYCSLISIFIITQSEASPKKLLKYRKVCLCSLISSFIILISPLIFMQSYLFTLSDSFIYNYTVIFQHSSLQSHSNIHLYIISFQHLSLRSLIPPTIFAQFYSFTHFTQSHFDIYYYSFIPTFIFTQCHSFIYL